MRIVCNCPACQRLRAAKASKARPHTDAMPPIYPDAQGAADVILYLAAAFLLAAVVAVVWWVMR
jgi:hypothetical protein